MEINCPEYKKSFSFNANNFDEAVQGIYEILISCAGSGAVDKAIYKYLRNHKNIKQYKPIAFYFLKALHGEDDD